MIAVDASVWVSFLAPQDLNHASTVEWMTRQRSTHEPILAPILLLAEVAGAIARRFADPSMGHEIMKSIRALPEMRLIPLDHVLGDLAADLAAALRLRGADATYVAVAMEHDVPLVSWDQEHLARASAIIPVFRPLTAP